MFGYVLLVILVTAGVTLAESFLIDIHDRNSL